MRSFDWGIMRICDKCVQTVAYLEGKSGLSIEYGHNPDTTKIGVHKKEGVLVGIVTVTDGQLVFSPDSAPQFKDYVLHEAEKLSSKTSSRG